ncbi:unnamed protein product [Didymodactylos carnosus]|uniref:Uncharacterized protein n=1 Tax=Didymodactylos carnosus TaxID=1234261 RepID=A0A814EEY6_9BILA|nr:unnamed protein product [Didymodactylos carnosus]CAF0966471.1 unnamed protein product [Didymodactylos carnosus]CAF3552336.1 unnamed protein product [Didymodactylos carnosus]CAF3739982.1 unnamed protein product [Didymodactylos carnosus]
MAEVLLKFVSIKNENIDNKHNSIIPLSTSTINGKKSNISQTEKNSLPYVLPIISVTNVSNLPKPNLSFSTTNNNDPKLQYRLVPLGNKMSSVAIQTPKRPSSNKLGRSNTFSVQQKLHTKSSNLNYRHTPITTTTFRPPTAGWRQTTNASPIRPPSTPYLYIVNSSTSNNQIVSAKPLIQRISSVRHDEVRQHSESTFSDYSRPSDYTDRIHSSNQTVAQYGHFLAYLRRKSVARLRRKQQGDTDSNTERDTNTTSVHSKHQLQQVPITIPQQKLKSCISPTLATNSNSSFGDCIVPINNNGKASSTPVTEQRNSAKKIPDKPPSAPWRLELRRSVSSAIDSKYHHRNNQVKPLIEMTNGLTVSKDTSLITPSNSIVDEPVSEKQEKKKKHESCYELQLAGDYLSYVYVSDSGVKYKGQLLSSDELMRKS